MARKRPTYTSDDLRALKERLHEQRRSLATRLHDCSIDLTRKPEFEGACLARDRAQELASTCLALQHIDDIIAMAERLGPISAIGFDPADCGLEAP